MINYSQFRKVCDPTPRLEIYPDRVRQNTEFIVKQCHDAHVSVACVTKVVGANIEVAKAMQAGGADMLADSRIENLYKLRDGGLKGPFMLLRLPTPSRAAETVEAADISLNSSIETIEALGRAAVAQNHVHRVIIMIDVGDLREGTWPDKAPKLVKAAASVPGIEVIGLGTNLACYGGVIPTPENMRLLMDTVSACRRSTELPLSVVCGGNSSGLPILASGRLPGGINLYRIGEAIMLGRNVIDRSPWPGTRQDTFILKAEVIEAETKPSKPIGTIGQDAFGNVPEFVDKGLRNRIICNLGRQDVTPDGLTPLDEGVEILGASSDHLIVDVTDCKRTFEVGDEIAFYPSYGALLSLITSEYIFKVIKEG